MHILMKIIFHVVEMAHDESPGSMRRERAPAAGIHERLPLQSSLDIPSVR